jgi:ubiquinol-cytochrome c reductase iron-sulfur subunit
VQFEPSLGRALCRACALCPVLQVRGSLIEGLTGGLLARFPKGASAHGPGKANRIPPASAWGKGALGQGVLWPDVCDGLFCAVAMAGDQVFGPPSSGAVSDSALAKVSKDMDYGSADHYFEKARLEPGNHTKKRAFTYFVLGGAKFIYASSIRLAIINAVATMSASADVLALASVEVNLGNVPEGETVTVKWRGKPVFIRHRSDEQIAEVAATPAGLRDPQDDKDRVQDPKWLIVLGICTHLGCVPMANAGDYQGWYCPCHGSHYDGSGRIRRGPAPLNLEVPPYRFVGDDKVILG